MTSDKEKSQNSMKGYPIPEEPNSTTASEHQRQAEQLGREMCESIKQLPPVH